MVLVKIVTMEEAKKMSTVKNKYLEQHLLRRLREYQIDLVNAIYDPEYYDYGTTTTFNRINAVIGQLKNGGDVK